jgi:GT2 family glycosyltransferase
MILDQLRQTHNKVTVLLLPWGTRRRRCYELVWFSISIIRSEGWNSFFKKLKTWFYNILKSTNRLSFPNLYRIETKQMETVYTEFSKYSVELPNVDIIITTYNSTPFLRNLLDSIRDLDYPKRLLKIIAIDNDSTDDTTSILKSASKEKIFAGFEVIESDKNLGYGKAVNIASKFGIAPFIFIINPDIKLSKDSLTILINQAIQDREAWLWEPRQFPYEHPKYYDPLTLETIWSSGAGFLIKRNRFIQLGGFDERFFMYAEDVDLSFRVWNSGGKCRYVPSAVIWHFSYSKPNEIKPLQWYYSLKNNILLRFKFGKFSEVLEGYCLLLGIFVKGQKSIRHSRWILVKLLFHNLKLIPSVILWRFRNKTNILNNYRFVGWDYEVVKLGAFYHNDYCFKKPLVSIVVRTMNRPAYLKEAIQSLVNQTYRPLEVIVIEDGPDTSHEVIDNFVGTSGITFSYHALGINLGRCRTGNEALALVTGEYINFLDDDDLLYPDHVEVLVQTLLRHENEYKAAYAASFQVKTTFCIDSIKRHEYTNFYLKYSIEELLSRNLFPIQAVLFHRTLYDLFGGFDQQLDVLEDWDLWLRYSIGTKYLSVEKTTSEFRIPENTSMRLKRQSILTNAYSKIRMKNGITKKEIL